MKRKKYYASYPLMFLCVCLLQLSRSLLLGSGTGAAKWRLHPLIGFILSFAGTGANNDCTLDIPALTRRVIELLRCLISGYAVALNELVSRHLGSPDDREDGEGSTYRLVTDSAAAAGAVAASSCSSIRAAGRGSPSRRSGGRSRSPHIVQNLPCALLGDVSIYVLNCVETESWLPGTASASSPSTATRGGDTPETSNRVLIESVGLVEQTRSFARLGVKIRARLVDIVVSPVLTRIAHA
eukprot:GHVU01232717.1.p1 GENE.GHVU01232717.1~~GHVU01232717.1.p1  ORF type:complete len:240 (-),score=25.86 GHVU01232717.1:370-1089(-)